MASSSTSHFFLPRQRKSNQKEGDPGLPPLRGTLRCSTGQAAAELALRAQTVLAETPWPVCATRRRSGEKEQKTKTKTEIVGWAQSRANPTELMDNAYELGADGI